MNEKQISQIHVRVDQETRNKWLLICDTLKGSTQTAIFKMIVNQISTTIKDIYKIKWDDPKEY